MEPPRPPPRGMGGAWLRARNAGGRGGRALLRAAGGGSGARGGGAGAGAGTGGAGGRGGCAAPPSTPSMGQAQGSLPPSARDSSPYVRELGLAHEAYEAAGGVRTRQHVNPLRREFQAARAAPDWAEAFPECGPGTPLTVDLGSGAGRFLLLLSHRGGGGHTALPLWAPGARGAPCNYLGLEIRGPLAERANGWAAFTGLAGRVRFEGAVNAAVCLGPWLRSYPGPVGLICLQFPDPHFKARHHKRRPWREGEGRLVREVAEQLEPGGHVFLQSDVLDVALDMRRAFFQGTADLLAPAGAHGDPRAVFFHAPAKEEDEEGGRGGADGWREAGWLRENPLGTPTEREMLVQEAGDPVYRLLLEKRGNLN